MKAGAKKGEATNGPKSRAKRKADAETILSRSGSSGYDVLYLLGAPNAATGKPKSVFGFLELAKAGVPRISVDRLSDYMGISKKAFSNNILHVSSRTLERKELQEKLDLYTSSKMVEVARVMAHAYEVFQDEDKVKNWLQRPNRALEGRPPIELMNLPTGLSLVDEVLGRIEEGVYS